MAPIHVPLVVVSVWPWAAVPETTGSLVFVGGPELEATTAVALEVAVVEPSEFVAVTLMRSLCPTSLESSSRWFVVSPEMLLQLLPFESQRTHWYAYVIGVDRPRCLGWPRASAP